MRRDGVQKDPIIIDRDSAAVLDGMHRLAAFGKMGVENAVCCAVDYSSEAVRLARWARVYTMPARGSTKDLLGALRSPRRVTLAQAFDALDSREAGLAALTSEWAYLPTPSTDLGLALATVAEFDRDCKRNGWEREFVPEDDIDVPLQSPGKVVVLLRKLGKSDIVTAARSGRLFPCTTSMHRIDPRPVAVNFPVDRLDQDASSVLDSMLKGSEQRLLPPDSMYEGRRYKERLLLLSQT